MTSGDRRAPLMMTTLEEYWKAFNDNDLDRVMTYFAEDALYCPGSGVERVGLAAIREEFEPQFGGAFGAMRFDERERIVDDKAGKIVVRYVCRHDLTHARAATLGQKLRRVIVGAALGDRFGWEGVDVFHFDQSGKIKEKHTYANYKQQPRLDKALGVELPPRPGEVQESWRA